MDPPLAVLRRGAGPRLPPENPAQPCQTRDGIGARRVVQRLQIGGSARESDGCRSRNRRIGVVRWGIAALRGDAPRGRSPSRTGRASSLRVREVLEVLMTTGTIKKV